MFCEKCGKEMPVGANACPFCQGNVQPVVCVNNGAGGLFPKNASALIAYYLGIASFLICITALPAVIFGIMGVIHAKKHPQSKGGAHAWAGIICGGIVLLVIIYLVFVGITEGSRGLERIACAIFDQF